MKKENSEKKEFIILVILFVIVVILGALFVYNRFFAEEKHSTLGEITEKEDIVDYYENRVEEVKKNDDEITDETILEASTTGLDDVKQSQVSFANDDVEIVLGDLTGTDLSKDGAFLYFNPKIKSSGNSKHIIYTYCDCGTIGSNYNAIRISYNDYINDNIHTEDMNEADCYFTNGNKIYDATSLYWAKSEICDSVANVYFIVIGMNNEKCLGVFKATIDCKKEPVLSNIEAVNFEYNANELYSDFEKFFDFNVMAKEDISTIYGYTTKEFLTDKYWTYKDGIEMSYTAIEHKQDNMLFLVLVTTWGGRYEVYLEPDTYEMICYRDFNLSDVVYDEVLESL